MNNDELTKQSKSEQQKNIKPKRDYIKLGLLLIVVLSISFNIYQYLLNNNLNTKNIVLNDKVKSLQNEVYEYIDLLDRKSRE